jgi:hypothetical protein
VEKQVEIEMSQAELYQWMSEILRHLPSIGKWQGLNVALFSVGVMLAEHTSVSHVSKWLWAFGERSSIEKRLKRYLRNTRLAWECLQIEWVRWVSHKFNAAQLVLLVDETKLGKSLSVMMVGLAYRARCIPLVWRCYQPKHYPVEGQVALIMQLLNVVKTALPLDCCPLVQADRGIGTSPTLLRGIAGLQWRYLVRVQNSVHLRTFRNKEHVLRNLVKRGEYWSGQGFVFKKSGAIRVFVHVYWHWQEQDMWCLLTNDPHLRHSSYAVRNWQEQSFRDLKSGGFNWQRSQVRIPAHAERLLLVLALAYARVLAFGSALDFSIQHDFLPTSRQSRPARSIFSHGLRHVWDCLVRHIVPSVNLILLPDKCWPSLLC